MLRILMGSLALVALVFAVPADARDWHHDHGYGRWGGHSHHFGSHYYSRPRLSVHLGVPLYWPRLGYYYSVPYPYPYSYPATQIIVERQPQVYVQREPAAAAATAEYWHYCPDSRTYYPYAQTCPSPWLQVVPQTSPQAAR